MRGSTARTTARIVLPDGSPLSRASDEEQIWFSHMISSDEEQIWISHMISDPGLMKELVREDAVDVTKQRPSSRPSLYTFTVDLHCRPDGMPRPESSCANALPHASGHVPLTPAHRLRAIPGSRRLRHREGRCIGRNHAHSRGRCIGRRLRHRR